jgi:hypothetical protein
VAVAGGHEYQGVARRTLPRPLRRLVPAVLPEGHTFKAFRMKQLLRTRYNPRPQQQE